MLHGYGFGYDTFNGRLATLPDSADRDIAAGSIKDMIIVLPDAYTIHKGSMYSNSITTGYWEDYIAVDLVAYIDSHYRTLATRMSRGLGGHSMGGYGALRIGMKHPDVFSVLDLMSSCCLNATLTFDPGRMAPAEAIKTREQAEEAGRGVAATERDRAVRGAARDVAADREVRGAAAVVAAVRKLAAAVDDDVAVPCTGAAAVEQLERALTATADAGDHERLGGHADVGRQLQ
jgi:pimeloyl-ACP methyl ester carboxylesterase